MLKDVTEITLNKEDMFNHFIELKKADGSLEARIKTLPVGSDDMFKDILKKWNEVIKEK